MRFRNWVAMAAGLVFATSCGSNSTKEEKTTVDTSGAVTTTTDMNSNNGNTSADASYPVPDTLKSTFQTKYPEVQSANWRRYQPTDNIDWDWAGWPKLDTSDYAVNFTMDSTDNWAWYDDSNNWVGTVTTIRDYNSLPAPVNKTINSQFSGYTITSVDREHDRKRVAYEIDMTKGADKAKALIDENGTVIKKKMVTDGERTKEKM